MMRGWWSGSTLLVAACGVLGPGRGDLDAARRTWQDLGYRDYAFTFRWECFCAYTKAVRIVVRDATVDEVTEVDTGNPPPSFGQTFPTIDDLFDLIQDAFDRHAYDVSAVYDDTRGFPISVHIDYEKNTIDEEQGFTVSALTSLP